MSADGFQTRCRTHALVTSSPEIIMRHHVAPFLFFSHLGGLIALPREHGISWDGSLAFFAFFALLFLERLGGIFCATDSGGRPYTQGASDLISLCLG